MTRAAVNYNTEYRLNFREIEEKIKITSWQRADNSICLNNAKLISFCSLIEPGIV